jgi:hypothetical protein
MRDTRLWFALVVAIAALLNGCGDDGDENANRETTGGRPGTGGEQAQVTGGTRVASSGAGSGGAMPNAGAGGADAGAPGLGMGGAGGEPNGMAGSGESPVNGGVTGGGASGSSQSCVDAFTAPLIDFEDVQVVTPIGLVGGGGTEIVGRSYVFPDPAIEGAVSLYAPTAMRLVGGVRYLPPGAPDDYHPDWGARVRTGLFLERVDRALPREGSRAGVARGAR